MSTTGVVFVLRIEADGLIEEMEIGNGSTGMIIVQPPKGTGAKR